MVIMFRMALMLQITSQENDQLPGKHSVSEFFWSKESIRFYLQTYWDVWICPQTGISFAIGKPAQLFSGCSIPSRVMYSVSKQWQWQRGEIHWKTHFSLELKTPKNIPHWKGFVRKHRKVLLIASICWNFWQRQDPAVQQSCGWSDSNQTFVFRILLLRKNEGLVLLLCQNTELCTGSQAGADVLFPGLVLSLQRTSWSNSTLCLHTTKTRVELVLGRTSLGQSVRVLSSQGGNPSLLPPTACPGQLLLPQLTSSKGLVEAKYL